MMSVVRSAALLGVGVLGSLLVAACDLAVGFGSAAPDPVTRGNNITYGIDVSSDGDGWTYLTASVCVDVDLPAGTSLVTATASTGSCSGSGPVTCDLGAFGPLAAETVSVTVATSGATPLGLATATATVRDCSLTLAQTTPNESTGANNVDTVSTTVEAALLCGNGVVDSGEDCEPSLSGECCTASCTYVPSGTPCTSDGSACTFDQCDGAGSCAHTFPAVYPLPTFGALATKASLQLKKNADPAKDKMAWKWTNATSIPTFESIVSPNLVFGYEYTLCVADGAGNLLLDLKAPFGTNWVQVSSGFKYKDTTLTPDGVLSVALKSGGGLPGKSKITFKGKGGNLSMPALQITALPVRARLLITVSGYDALGG
ncbi:MAG: hypothetical protein ACREQL_09475, partial [Candidatus Binatia bacterium]